MRILTSALIFLTLSLALPANAARVLPSGNVPDTPPLQPIPENTMPNLENSIDFQSNPVDNEHIEIPQNSEERGDGVNPADAAPDEMDDLQNLPDSTRGTKLLWIGFGIVGIILAFLARKKTPK
ncbi:MAG: hypothetical protein UY65_C0001G0005 [Parcubacteria group bacterium GW2011_GWA2_51_12]|nr:MAG: hypothetical protein UY65_C0001G0005 [Parcubacteria group bacterium GW2011_GWA2_51_12]